MTKNNHFEKSHKLENLLQNIKKIEGGPFGDTKKLRKKNEK